MVVVGVALKRDFLGLTMRFGVTGVTKLFSFWITLICILGIAI